MVPEERSAAEIEALRTARGGPWPAIRWIHQRRPVLTALLVVLLPVHSVLTGTPPADLLDPRSEWRFWVPWTLMGFGAAIRIWGSGNLRKNREVTTTGVYRMVRHPLYTGSLAFFLAYFLTAGEPLLGLVLFALLTLGVYYPTMLGEEEYLSLRFPRQARERAPLPRLIPHPLLLPAALRSDDFRLGAASTNLGLRSFAFLLFLPIFLELLDRIVRLR